MMLQWMAGRWLSCLMCIVVAVFPPFISCHIGQICVCHIMCALPQPPASHMLDHPNAADPKLCCIKLYKSEAAWRPPDACDSFHLALKRNKKQVQYRHACVKLTHADQHDRDMHGMPYAYYLHQGHAERLCLHDSYGKGPMGVHSCSRSVIQDLCAAAGIPRTTNHSMTRTSISIMYRLKIPEGEIASRSRHKSIFQALRDYYRSDCCCAFCLDMCPIGCMAIAFVTAD